MDTEKRPAKRLNFLRKSIYISCGNINEAMNTLSCGSLYEAINMRHEGLEPPTRGLRVRCSTN